MPNDKRITLKFLGALMESVNITPNELRKTLWSAGRLLALLILLWRLPELINAFKGW